MRQFLANHIKNIPGWTTKRKLVLFAVDDYGNVRLNSKEAKSNLQKEGVKLSNHFDQFDALDTTEDFELLYETLSNVKDLHKRPAKFTCYSMSCNVDFEATISNGEFVHENLPDTYRRLEADTPSSYGGAYNLLLEGINKGLIVPQFHGREHLNIQLFNLQLKEKNSILWANLHNRSLCAIPDHKDLPGVGFTQAFAFWNEEETVQHEEILKDGLERFRNIYGFHSATFAPPALKLHPKLKQTLVELDIISIDKNRVAEQHLGNGKSEREKSYLGYNRDEKLVNIVRNCVFEPVSSDIDWVNFTFNQIKAAFFWNKPAIISSHRVNFCGHIDPENRKKGLSTLDSLLKKIVKTWPDVEFIGIDELAEIIKKEID